jgi:hypothetical protein
MKKDKREFCFKGGLQVNYQLLLPLARPAPSRVVNSSLNPATKLLPALGVFALLAVPNVL